MHIKRCQTSKLNHLSSSYQNVNSRTVALAAPAQNQSKCRRFGHDDIPMAAKEEAKEAKAALVKNLGRKKVTVRRL